MENKIWDKEKVSFETLVALEQHLSSEYMKVSSWFYQNQKLEHKEQEIKHNAKVTKQLEKALNEVRGALRERRKKEFGIDIQPMIL